MYHARTDRAALIALIVLFVLAQVLLRLPGIALQLGRWLLVPHLVVAAAAFWPLRHAGGSIPPGNTAGTMILSAVTVIATCMLTPLWADHGCWAPDLVSLVSMVLSGLVLALVLSLNVRRVSRLRPETLRKITAVFLATLSVGASVSIGAGMRRQAELSPLLEETNTARPLWSRTPWQGLWAYVAPRPWLRPAYAPADPAVTDVGKVVFVSLSDRVEILDARDGRLSQVFTVSPPGSLATADSARNTWRRPVVSSDHVLLVNRGGTAAILDLADKAAREVRLDGTIVEAAPAKNGFFVLEYTNRFALTLLDPDGRPVWSTKPGISSPKSELVDFQVNQVSGPRVSSLLIPTPHGIVCLDSDVLFVCDGQTGRLLWQKAPQGRFTGLQVSVPRGIVYAVDSGPDANRVTAYSIAGEALWSKELPAGCHGLIWAATDGGLLIAPQLREAGTACFLDFEGHERWTAPIPQNEPFAVEAHGGMVFLVSSVGIQAYDEKTGSHIWGLPQRSRPSPAEHIQYYSGLALFGDTILVPRNGFLTAHDIRTGRVTWSYAPPGGLLGIEVGEGVVFATSYRGLFAVAP